MRPNKVEGQNVPRCLHHVQVRQGLRRVRGVPEDAEPPLQELRQDGHKVQEGQRLQGKPG